MKRRARPKGRIVWGGVAGTAVGMLALAGCLGGSHVGPTPGPAGTAGTGNAAPAGTGGGPAGMDAGAPAGTQGGTFGGAGTGGTVGGVPGRGGASGGPGGTISACSASGTGGTGGVSGRGLIIPADPGGLVSAATPPPAVSGGTLRLLSDGQTVVAADPDRDQIHLVDLSTKAVTTVPLLAGDEPGRVIEDGAGRVHVALRHGGALVSFDPRQADTVTRRAVCAAPRGLAYDASADLVHVACRDGELISLPAAGGGGATRTLQLDRDLRDVVVDGTRLRVSRFRTAELLTVEADGTVSQRLTPPAFTSASARTGETFTPGAAWRMLPTADGGVAMLHQRGLIDAINPVTGGYGNFNPCNAIVHPTVTAVAADGTMKSGPALPGLVLAVDMAISADGRRVAFLSLGNATNHMTGSTSGPQLTRLFVTDYATATDPTIGCKPDGTHGPCLPPGSALMTADGLLTSCPPDATVVGQPIAVAFAGDGRVIVQSREPAMLALTDGTSIPLSDVSRADTGHLVFHANAGGFIACGSCHLEGDEDGRVWTFNGCAGTTTVENPRRTQSLQTGLRGSEPFHWNGDEADFPQLMKDVFVTRMSGPSLASDASNALLSWIDAQPRPLRASPLDPAAVQRGAALFNDAQSVGCVVCHAGARFSNNMSADVGTGRAFQVPSLLGVGTRGPFMHDGCAATLRDRFNTVCGGDSRHGNTANLSAGQIDDLIAYLGSL